MQAIIPSGVLQRPLACSPEISSRRCLSQEDCSQPRCTCTASMLSLHTCCSSSHPFGPGLKPSMCLPCSPASSTLWRCPCSTPGWRPAPGPSPCWRLPSSTGRVGLLWTPRQLRPQLARLLRRQQLPRLLLLLKQILQVSVYMLSRPALLVLRPWHARWRQKLVSVALCTAGINGMGAG